jgi:predicted nucleic acid-binding protein
MILLDSNIIIYAAQPAFIELRAWLGTQVCTVSELSRLEVMGYHLLKENERQFFVHFFNEILSWSISSEIIEIAIPLRRTYNMSLGDAVIAATALQHKCTLCTNNKKDFEKADELRLVDISQFI